MKPNRRPLQGLRHCNEPGTVCHHPTEERPIGNKLTPKVILEGTRLTFKTEMAFELNEHPRFVGPRKYRYHSPLISGEWCAFTNFPWGQGLINYQPQ